MIPIRDAIPSRNKPIVNMAIIGINCVIFLVELTKGSQLSTFIFTYGFVPARYTNPVYLEYFPFYLQFFSLFSFMFLHGGFLHLLGNMWSLYIFGDNVEDHFGPIHYLLFYILCGLASGFSHFVLNPNSTIPVVGASGAIAGVMGAYFILYPRSKILTLIPIFFIPWFMELPAVVSLGIWFLIQVINAAGDSAGGIAWMAHVGGFISGVLLLKVLPGLPMMGLSEKLRQLTVKHHSPALQTIPTTGVGDNPNLYGSIIITSKEAWKGTQKLVNIPWGRFSKLYRIKIPAGIAQGKRIRLKGLGSRDRTGKLGDLYLRVIIE